MRTRQVSRERKVARLGWAGLLGRDADTHAPSPRAGKSIPLPLCARQHRGQALKAEQGFTVKGERNILQTGLSSEAQQ